MILTTLYGALLGLIAFGLTRPLDPRRLAAGAAIGGVLGLAAAYFNLYPGSLRAALLLLAIAFFLAGGRAGQRFGDVREPLVPRLPWVGAGIAILLILAALYPYTQAGARSVEEPLYEQLSANVVEGPAPPLVDPSDARVVPWDLASELVVRGYGADASFLETNPGLLLRNTYPDTVNGEFVWVHAPTPETAKWVFGSRTADKIVYVRNNASDLEPRVIDGTLQVHVDGRFWQDRVARYAQEHGAFRWALQDVALQLDDERRPHWIAYLARIDLKNQPHMETLLVIDAYTGEENAYGLHEVPGWIEMVYPESYVYYWAQYWGTWREGVMYRWFDANRLMTPDDVTVRYIRLDGDTYWLLPMRQLNAPQLGGYVLVDTRTGDSTFYDRFDDRLVDYDTALNQLKAIMASGEATGGQGLINLAVREGYLYPVQMHDGSVRDAYVFPLLEGLKVSNFAIIDAKDYQSRRVFAPTMDRALRAFANQTTGVVDAPIETPTTGLEPERLRVVDGVSGPERILVNLNGTHHRVTMEDLARGNRLDAAREWDELELAIARANRGDEVELDVLIVEGRLVDVTYPGIEWGA